MTDDKSSIEVAKDLDALKLKPGDIVMFRDRDPKQETVAKFLRQMAMAKSRIPLLNDVLFIGVPHDLDMMVLDREEYPRELAEKYDAYAVMKRSIAKQREQGIEPTPGDMEKFNQLKDEVGRYDFGGDITQENNSQAAHTS